MSQYFGPDVDVWIVKCNSIEDKAEKNKIFEKHVYPVFLKLISGCVHKRKFHLTIEDCDIVMVECLAHLYEVMPKFDHTRNTKGFSYFNQITNNFFIGKQRDRNKKQKFQSATVDLDHEAVKNNPSIVGASYEDEILEKEFWLSLFEDMEDWRCFVKKKQEEQVLDAIKLMLQNPHLIPIFNKKVVGLYIKEMTGLTTKQVNQSINRLKLLYKEFRAEMSR